MELPRTLSKDSERSIPNLTQLQELLNIILHNLPRYTELRHWGKNTIPYGAAL